MGARRARRVEMTCQDIEHNRDLLGLDNDDALAQNAKNGCNAQPPSTAIRLP